MATASPSARSRAVDGSAADRLVPGTRVMTSANTSAAAGPPIATPSSRGPGTSDPAIASRAATSVAKRATVDSSPTRTTIASTSEFDNFISHGGSPRRNPLTDTTDAPGPTQFVTQLSNVGSGCTINSR